MGVDFSREGGESFSVLVFCFVFVFVVQAGLKYCVGFKIILLPPPPSQVCCNIVNDAGGPNPELHPPR